MQLIIVSGRSGSGKSIALSILEDLGYYCIDNLPLRLLRELHQSIQPRFNKLAISIDVRNLGEETEILPDFLKTLHNVYSSCRILFLDADDATLIERFSESRRKHPLTDGKITLSDALKKEYILLEPLMKLADLKLDTSHHNLHTLQQAIQDYLDHAHIEMSVLLQSFGYKFGIPIDSDFIFDARFLPNPNWEKELQPLTGKDNAVEQYLNKFPEVDKYHQSIKQFLIKWLKAFEKDNRSYLTISIGCTGGRHRSVFLIEKLARDLAGSYKNLTIRHRELI